MPKCKNYLIDVPRFYKYNAFDHIMFGYVQGIRKALPSMKVAEAIRMFLDSFQIDDENYCFENARVTYTRMIGAIVTMNQQSEKPDDNLII